MCPLHQVFPIQIFIRWQSIRPSCGGAFSRGQGHSASRAPGGPLLWGLSREGGCPLPLDARKASLLSHPHSEGAYWASKCSLPPVTRLSMVVSAITRVHRTLAALTSKGPLEGPPCPSGLHKITYVQALRVAPGTCAGRASTVQGARSTAGFGRWRSAGVPA